MAAQSLSIVACTPSSNPRQSLFPTQQSHSLVKWHLTGGQHSRLFTRTTRGHAFRMLADPNFSSGRRNSKKEVIMVDPMEAKRLASKQMDEIKAKEKLKRRRQIEAINGAWAVIGLTAGLVIEGHTGKSIPSQLAGYFDAIVSFFVR